jgi:hypothetical protein
MNCQHCDNPLGMPCCYVCQPELPPLQPQSARLVWETKPNEHQNNPKPITVAPGQAASQT